jgi:hypothetical protein
MAVFRYEGAADVREVWGTSFPHGKTVEVDDEALIRKVSALGGFVRVDVAETPEPAPEPEPVADPPADDYEPVEEIEVTFPAVGAGLVPEGWETMHWKTKVKLAKELTGKDCANAAEADAALREAMEPR